MYECNKTLFAAVAGEMSCITFQSLFRTWTASTVCKTHIVAQHLQGRRKRKITEHCSLFCLFKIFQLFNKYQVHIVREVNNRLTIVWQEMWQYYIKISQEVDTNYDNSSDVLVNSTSIFVSYYIYIFEALLA